MRCEDFPLCGHSNCDTDEYPYEVPSNTVLYNFISLVYLGGLMAVAWVILHFIVKYW